MSLPPPYQGPGRGRPNVQSKSENESEVSSDKESGPQLDSGAKAWTKMEGKLLEVPVATEKILNAKSKSATNQTSWQTRS